MRLGAVAQTERAPHEAVAPRATGPHRAVMIAVMTASPADPRRVPPVLDNTVGLWTGTLDALDARAAQEAVAELDELGYPAIWFGEAYGREAFTAAALLLAACPRMGVATGIANIYARDPVSANAAGRALHDAYRDRFVLGLGVSHRPLVERLRGHEYLSPLETMTSYLAAMDSARFMAAGPPDAPARVIAALGPKMLDVARDHCDGAHPYLVTPAHTAEARARLGDTPILAVEQAVVLTSDEATFRSRAHAHLEIYTGLPNYRNSWRRQGYGDEDFVRGRSERLADALVVWGDEARICARIQEHLDAGADHVCVQVLGTDPFTPPFEDWRTLAPSLTPLRHP